MTSLHDSSINSDDSEVTTPRASTSRQEAKSGSTPTAELSTTESVLSQGSIRYEERVMVVGATGTGKSTLTKKLFLSTAAPRLIVDPADSTLTASAASPGGTFSDPLRVPDVATARFVPRDPDDRDAYNALFRWAFARFPRYVWVDEAGQVAPASGYPREVNRYVVQGRKRALGIIGCHTRPREVMRNFIAQASHLFVFDLPNPDDRKHIADIAGLRAVDLDAALMELEEKGFLWWNGNTRTLTICPRLRGV